MQPTTQIVIQKKPSKTFAIRISADLQTRITAVRERARTHGMQIPLSPVLQTQLEKAVQMAEQDLNKLDHAALTATPSMPAAPASVPHVAAS